MAASTKASAETVKNILENNEEVLTKVKTTLKDGFESVKNAVNFESAPEFVKETVVAQATLAENWFDSLARVAKVKSTEELTEIFNEQVKHFQKNLTTAMDVDFWKKGAKKGAELKVADYMNAEFAKETILKVIDLCQPAK